MPTADIESAIAAIERFTAAPAPAFRCTTSGPGERIVLLRHLLGQSARREELATLRDMLPNAPAGLIRFYERHNGLVLYAGLSPLGTSVCLYPIGEWKSATRRYQKGKPSDRMPAPAGDDAAEIRNGVAIGELVGSGHYFVIPKRGARSRDVFYVAQDAEAERPFAESFERFLLALVDDPPRLLMEHLGGAVSYSDGTTDQHWTPAEYVADARTIDAQRESAASTSSRPRRLTEDALVDAVRSRATRGSPQPRPTDAALRAAAETMSGSLHPLYARLLREVGNGGFGPGQGLLGLEGGHGDRDGRNALELRELLWPPSARPAGLIPLCEWDDGVWSLLDRDSGAVITLDETGFTNTGDDLHAWLEKWLDGVDLYGSMFDARGLARGTRFTPRSRG